MILVVEFTSGRSDKNGPAKGQLKSKRFNYHLIPRAAWTNLACVQNLLPSPLCDFFLRGGGGVCTHRLRQIYRISILITFRTTSEQFTYVLHNYKFLYSVDFSLHFVHSR